MNRYRLTELVADQREHFLARACGVVREVDVESHREHPRAVVISGVRRCGKSTLLRQVAETLDGVFHYLNLDDERLIDFDLSDFEDLMVVFGTMSDARTLLLDEIQNVEGWERFVRRVHDDGYKVYLTGSNAELLSSELGSRLTGRYVLIELYPFSFREVLRFREIDPDRRTTRGRAAVLKAFDEYLTDGGFPEYLTYDDREFLSRTYSDIIHRDIISRFGIRDVRAFQHLAHYLFSNVTGDMSYNRLSDTLGIASPVTVRDYIGYLEQSYLAFELYKYDYSLKKQHVSSKKVYVIDNGMRNAVAFRFSEDRGKALENTVYLELRRRSGTVCFHRDRRECDFIVVDRGVVVAAYQVCAELTPENRDRELAGLDCALKQFGLDCGMILTMDQSQEIEMEENRAAQVMPVWRWLIAERR